MNPDPRGYYAALHVAPDATQQEISRAFRSIMRLLHPDVGGSDGGDARDVRGILDAYAVLRNPTSRADYDRPESHAPARGSTGQESRDIPVRQARHREPLLRVSPVRWERGPWRG